MFQDALGLSPVSCLFVCSSEVADRLVVLSDRVLPFTDRTGPFVRDPSVSRSMYGIALVSQQMPGGRADAL